MRHVDKPLVQRSQAPDLRLSHTAPIDALDPKLRHEFYASFHQITGVYQVGTLIIMDTLWTRVSRSSLEGALLDLVVK